MKKPKIKITTPTPAEIQAWFAKHGATMTVKDTGSAEVEFHAADQTEYLSVEVRYEEGCPTCGGAYVKELRRYSVTNYSGVTK